MADLIQVKSMLRGVLMSSKEGVPAHVLQRDYRAITEEALPFRKLGFSNLDDFISSIPDVVTIRRNNQGEIMYHAVASEQTAHIAKMVTKQKSTRKRGVKLRAPQRRPAHRPQLLSPPTSNRPFSRPPAPWEPRRNNRNIQIVLTDNKRGNPKRSVQFGKTGQKILQRAISEANTQRNSRNQGGGFGSRFEVPPRFRNQTTTEKLPNSSEKTSNERPLPTGKKKHDKKGGDVLGTVPDGKKYWDMLKKYALDNNITPVTFNSITGKSGQTKGYASTLEFQGKTYGSEDLFATEDDAEYAVCKKICQELRIENRRGDMQNVHGSSSVSDTVLRSRIIELINGKTNGVWKKRLCVLYRDIYKEEPPDDLLRRVSNWTDIATVQQSTVPDDEIIVPVPPDVQPQAKGDNPDKIQQTPQKISPVPSITPTQPSPPQPAPTPKDSSYPPSMYKYLKVPKALSLPYMEKITVYVTYVHSCAYFCLQREDSPIEEIGEVLAEQATQKNAPKPSKSELIRGRFCASVYTEDGSWSRAEVLKQDEEGCGVEVLYIDFGNSEKCYPSSTMWLNEKTAAYPVQAIYCSLHGIQPLKDEDWSDESMKMFAQLVQNQALTAITKSYSVEGVCEVELFCPNNDVSINQQLINAKVVRPLSDDDTLEEAAEEEDSVINPDTEPAALTFPEGDQYDVYVSYVNSTTDSVMLRLVGEDYSEKLDDLESKMETSFHDCPDENPINIGSVYIAYVDSLFHRVRVLDVLEKKIECEFLDHGDVDYLIPDELRPLDPSLNKSLPYQAVEVSLYGLEEVADHGTVLEKLYDLALGKTCVAEVVSRDDCLSVILYDTFGMEDVNINETIVKALIAEAETSLLVSHSSPAESLSSLGDKFSDSGSPLSTRKNSKQLSKPVSASPPDKSTETDQPCPDKTPSSLTSPKTKKSPVISNPKTWHSPASPLKRNISKESEDSWETESEEELEGEGKSNQKVKREVKSESSETSGDSKSNLYTWGSSIVDKVSSDLTDLHLDRSEGCVSRGGEEEEDEHMWDTKSYHDRQLPVPLEHPKEKDFYDIHVAFVFDPGNFVCTPYEFLSQLEQIHEDLRCYFDTFPPSDKKILEDEDIKMNHLYAGQIDGQWCRVVTNQVVSPGLLSIYLPDIGEYNAMETLELQPLPSKFWSLPFQAFRAKLVGVIPARGAQVWSEAAKFKMKEVVEGKNMVGLVCGEEGGVLSLKLVDTSTDDDICIDEVLLSLELADINIDSIL